MARALPLTGLEWQERKKNIKEASPMPRPNTYRDQARDAERYFPVRIRVARDQLGRDKQYEMMARWCDEQFGPAR